MPKTGVTPNPEPIPGDVSKGGRRCAQCGEPVVEINLLIDGQAITMRSCSECDTRSWHRDGHEIDLGGVLADLSNTPTRYRRDLANR